MEKKDEGGNDGLPAPALKTEKESKYQGAFQEDDAIEDGASLISALAFGDVSPRRPPKSPAAATATENSIETIPSKDGDETQQTVAFQEEDTIIDPPTLSRGQTKDSIAPRPGPGHLKESLALPEDGHDPGSMAYIYQEGIQTPFRSRVAVANVVRKENKVDIESGKCTWRQMTATPVWDFKEPMNPIERRAAMVKKYADRNYYSEDDVAQYRLHSSNVNKKMASRQETIPWLTSYLHWTFRASFFAVVVTDFIAFFFLCWAWACAIYVGALVNPRCFVSGGTTLSEIEDWQQEFYFQDAFQLSWTTFSTVGYGVVYPQVNRQDPNRGASCSGFTFLVSLESFVGILFASFCGAIIFGKIARIQSIAQIRFSEPMVIRYGTGVLEGKPEDPDNDEDESDDGDGNKDTENRKEQGSGLTDTSMPAKTAGSNKSTKTVKFPPPVLEFRVINKLSMQKGGEIMNANINVVASTLEAKAIESLQFAEEKDKHDPLSPRNILRMGKEITHKTGKAILKTKDVTAKAAHKTVKVASSATHATSKALLRGSTGVKNTSGSLVQKLNRSIARTPLLETTPMSSFSENNEREAEPYNKEKQLVRDLRKQFALASLMAAAQSTRHLVCDEGNTGGLVPRRIFCKLEVDTDTHPFFKRVWIIRHVLNEESPLLTAKAKKIIHANHGKWPQDICNPEFIRDNLHFHQIIVSLTGTQNSSGSSVFGLNVYEFNSVNVGYTFVKMLDVNSEGKLFVDEELLNDVREQKGGGAEEIRGHRVDGFGTGRYGVTDGSGRQ